MQPVIDFLLPFLRPFEGLLKSRKFWSLLLAVLVSDFGLNLTDNVQAMIYLIAGVVFAGTTAWEDGAVKRAGVTTTVSTPYVSVSGNKLAEFASTMSSTEIG